MKHPIPESALDDRLGFVGTAGSGKTYNAGSGVERLLNSRARVVIPDPLGVWWGLRLRADGKTPSDFDVVIFGGPHGDLPLTEHAGALIGETVAGMKESCILDLSQLGTKAAERRFMLAFLTSLYKHTTGEPMHVIFDEADMWAPQRLLDKDGDAARLLGMMETVVRRGRVKGFIPWLITQRPAVLSKDVLSQIDGLVAFKLTSSQDRDAIGDWVQGQADKKVWAEIWANLPTMERGQGVVWIPARGLLKTSQFPEKTTFDSSRTPRRGEKAQRTAQLKPLNLERVKDRLATVEAEAKTNDPRALKADIAKLRAERDALERQIAAASAQKPAADPDAIRKAEERGFEQAQKKLAREAEREVQKRIVAFVEEFRATLQPIDKWLADKLSGAKRATVELSIEYAAPPVAPHRPASASHHHAITPVQVGGAHSDGVEKPLQKIINAIRWWNVLGIASPSHAQVGFIAGYSHNSGTWSTYLSRLRTAGLIEGRGDLVLTEAGLAISAAPASPPSGQQLRATVLARIDGPLRTILAPIIDAYPNALSHAEAGERSGYSHTSGTWSTYLSRLRSLDLIDGRGELKASDWLFP